MADDSSLSLQTSSFKSRFLKTDRSEALVKAEQGAPSGAPASTAIGLRAFRSTFSPLAKLPENVEVSSTAASAAPNGDNLSKNIKDFISRTDHVNGLSKRANSVERSSGIPDDFNLYPRAPPSVSRDPFYSRVGRDSSGYGSSYHMNNDFTSSYSVRSVSHSVTNRARVLNNGGLQKSTALGPPPPQRFMSLEEECNWILSGREPLMYNDNGYDDEDDEDNTLDDISGDELSEMAADLGEEHSSATVATSERLEAGQSERTSQDKDRKDTEKRQRREMSISYRKPIMIETNGAHVVVHDDEDGLMDPLIYKQKYESILKELEYTKKRLLTQHEDDLEQLLGLKKQLEKKLNDAYEEVDEQRQVVAQWKRKSQTSAGELNDIKTLLEEQLARNGLLEKKLRKFESDVMVYEEDKKRDILAREKLQREVDAFKAQKLSQDERLHAMKLDLDYKDEKINSLAKEIEDLSSIGASEEEVATLKRQKNDLEGRLKDQEEELDDLASQVQMLEAAKTKLEMSMAALKKEHRREVANKEEELEDVRAAAQKKVKALEQQLENEHEERINFVREKHELETRIINLQEMASRSADEEQVSKLKKDLKRTKALLKDAQVMMERSKNESSSKVVLRQLKNQLEDAEFARTAALKSKQNLELELCDVQQQLEDVMRTKSDVEDKLMRASREKTDLSTQLEDNEEELQEVMKKYKAMVSQLSVDQITIQEQSNRISDLEDERNRMKEQVAELNARIQSLEGEHIMNPAQGRLELKVKELESKLDLEQTTRGRMDTQINRLKEAIDKLNIECDSLRNKEASAQEATRKLQRQLRDLKEDHANLVQKELETNSKKNEFEKLLELAEAETVTARNDLKLALKRIEDLQTAINGELDSESDLNSDADSDSSEEGMSGFLEHHRRAISVQRERESMARDSVAREILQREVRASVARESVARQLETMSEEPELSDIESNAISNKSDGDSSDDE